MKLSRRQLLGWGLGGGATLGLGLFSLDATTPAPADSHAYRFLQPLDRQILLAIIPVMLAGLGSTPQLEAASRAVIRDMDAAIAGLPLRTQAELRQLFELLSARLGRVALAGIWADWAEADEAQLEAFLTHWRHSLFALLRTAYAGLHDLVLGVWYGRPEAWGPLAYDGPPELVP